jgi:pimeloyl-ACP methyl ester carboxylesterase
MTVPIALLLALCWQASAGSGATTLDIRVPSGGVRLAATITIPAGTAKRAGIVLIGGSGPTTRQMTRRYAEHFNTLGLVTLTYDKRGVGESEGDWTATSLAELADDAAAAIAALRARPEVDPDRVGVWGVSQGGWVVPMLATRNPRPAFAIVLTGGGASPRDVELAGYRLTLERVGATPSEAAAAEAILDKYFAWLGSGRGRAALDAEVAKVRDQPWFKALGLTRVMPSEAARPKWEWVATHDPVTAISEINFPTLVILGENDRLAPADNAARQWRAGFERSGYRGFRIEIVTGMGHSAQVGDMHAMNAPVSPRYLELLEGWIHQQVRR